MAGDIRSGIRSFQIGIQYPVPVLAFSVLLHLLQAKSERLSEEKKRLFRLVFDGIFRVAIKFVFVLFGQSTPSSRVCNSTVNSETMNSRPTTLRRLLVLLLWGTVGAVSNYHSKPIPTEARGGLLEYSVIYTDRATNSMSTTFQASFPLIISPSPSLESTSSQNSSLQNSISCFSIVCDGVLMISPIR